MNQSKMTQKDLEYLAGKIREAAIKRGMSPLEYAEKVRQGKI